MIAIIDYKAGNLTSVKRALDHLGQEAVITNDYEKVIRSERVIFPGVGAAGTAIADLKKQNLDKALLRSLTDKKPILGICLGTHIIMERSQENNTRCLGMVKGEVRRFPEDLKDSEGRRLKVPHMGWNSIELRRSHPLFDGIVHENEFYFVHSYYPAPSNSENVLAETSYGITFASVITLGNFVAMQFHPEKSGNPGLKILENFCNWDGKGHVE
jgi:imidazole glycerol-phosphate synthase subunit HisH